MAFFIYTASSLYKTSILAVATLLESISPQQMQCIASTAVLGSMRSATCLRVAKMIDAATHKMSDGCAVQLSKCGWHGLHADPLLSSGSDCDSPSDNTADTARSQFPSHGSFGPSGSWRSESVSGACMCTWMWFSSIHQAPLLDLCSYGLQRPELVPDVCSSG